MHNGGLEGFSSYPYYWMPDRQMSERTTRSAHEYIDRKQYTLDHSSSLWLALLRAEELSFCLLQSSPTDKTPLSTSSMCWTRRMSPYPATFGAAAGVCASTSHGRGTATSFRTSETSTPTSKISCALQYPRRRVRSCRGPAGAV
ncbi:hypothetical protein JG687_00011608 [Phytophthora cactorum]|uniref:Uncharacterized protein n=1 Tax=Phytophthora cactorum TaxID=29920 RepID=A0A8T1U3X0_9STRA|nr:hypothetical protein GQ600_231 [Phytophthora cactorum]KAF1786283.1 hypothetical protein GQ600_12015 [Phytophthora cactorum]KAG6954766.1 hypothetical protein JG687_00011608 [Phytophthora cactorum]